ncbi:MAG: ANTAR domain-containing response regulator [Gammaproteobacteria bacterium]
MPKVLLFDDGADTAHPLREAVLAAGCVIVGEITSARVLADAIARLAPDAVLMDVNSPSRDVLEQVVVASRDEPRPIVMFTPDGSDTAIEAALQAGVSAYVVDGIAASRIQSILQVAITRFRVDRRLREKLDDTEQRLAERKLVDRAKGLLMQHEKMDEAAAYAAMRSAAMKRGIKLAELAKQIIGAAERRA